MKLKIVTNWGSIECSDTNIKWSPDRALLYIKTNAINLIIPAEKVIEVKTI